MEEAVAIVNKDDQIIGSKPRQSVTHADIYRVASLWLTDAKTGDCLLAQRKWNKQNNPGKWATAVSGTVAADETYESNIRKETVEEIGLDNVVFTVGPKQYVDDGKHRFFCQWYIAQIDKDNTQIVFQEAEIEAVRWMTVKQLAADVIAHPDRYTPLAAESLKLLGVLQDHLL